ncbi:MAG: NADH:ubiquinone oxidoreductase subunit J [Micrococcales bacterium]|nr:MAG: NADH:ubiquinone oxidoreductase subunit J [Micrococcales bacterium]PIE25810.1 MAG: NADH:ubiquinone oxidoreductase subunit J [Micrococcales bacterium]
MSPVPIGGGEATLFWIVAPIMVIAAGGLIFVRNAVHAALLMVATMVGLAVLYAAQDAPFMFAAQIVVYTGAVMMLFLFVLMLVGVDRQVSLKETISGQRAATWLAGAGIGVLLVGMFTGMNFGPLSWNGYSPPAQALNDASNPTGVARLIFGQRVFALEIVGTLLITAAVGAIMLTHQERLTPPKTQKALAAERVRTGHAAPLPGPGVFARHNGVDTPALLPDGTPSELSVSRVLQVRGQAAGDEKVSELTESVAGIRADIEGERS